MLGSPEAYRLDDDAIANRRENKNKMADKMVPSSKDSPFFLWSMNNEYVIAMKSYLASTLYSNLLHALTYV